MLIVALWAMFEAVLFFIVADVPIMAVGALHGRKRALGAALIAALAAAAGGLVTLAWAANDPGGSLAAIERLPGITPAQYAQASVQWQDDGVMGLLHGSLSGVPYKLYAHAAGVAGAAPAWFFAASVIARLPRFLAAAMISGTYGPRLLARFGARRFWTGFVLAWALFYACYFAIMGL